MTSEYIPAVNATVNFGKALSIICAFGDSTTNVWLCDHIMDVIQEYCLNNPNCPVYVQNPYSEDKCTPLF